MFFVDPRRFTVSQLTDRLVSAFGRESGDVQSVTATVTQALAVFTQLPRVSVVLAHGDDVYQVMNPGSSLVFADDSPITRYVRECAVDGAVLYPLPDSPEHFTLAVQFEQVVAILPLMYEEQLLGWIAFHHQDPFHRLPRRILRGLDQIRPLVALGFRALWMDQILVERIEEMEIISRISRTMNSSLNVKETLETVMDAVIEFSGADRALMYLIDDAGEHFIPSLGRGMEPDISLDFRVAIDQSIFRHVIREREPLVVTDALNDPRVNKEYAEAVKTRSFVAVPMMTKERVLGIIGVDNYYTNRSVEEIGLDFLVTLANHAAIALANSQLYEQLEGFNEQLQERVREATDHLQQLVDMKSHFLNIASHQLRTPTTIVKGLLSMLVEDVDTPIEQQRHMIEQAYASTNRLERIISELLTATELEDASSAAFHEEVHAVALTQEVVEQLTPLAEQRELELTLQPTDASGDYVLTTDRFKLTEALANLVDNAIRYTSSGSVIVQVEPTDSHVVFHVQDTGIGLTEEDRRTIFEKFSRGKRAYDVEPNGTGLGLFIVDRIVEILQAEIQVQSEGPQRGSRFSLRVPRCPSTVPEPIHSKSLA